MNATPDDLKVQDVLDLKSQQMLVVNPEYQRGVVWTPSQKKKLVDSVLRGYPIPLIYFHHIRQQAGKLVSERFEVIDGQQRINEALIARGIMPDLSDAYRSKSRPKQFLHMRK